MEREAFEPRLTIGPRVRKSPYFEATKRYGAKSFTVYNHMYMPTGYTDPVDEYAPPRSETEPWCCWASNRAFASQSY